ncbi:MAG TPA: thioredoxin family protein [Aggregatilineales bacterium]|nr:thioredoxin family protein [Aggregatilineales bacterium]
MVKMIGPIQLAEFEENGVRVVIALERDAKADACLAATYTPRAPGFHLYDSGLPRTGINGVGRPTLLEIVTTQGIEPSGPLSASVAPLEDRLVGFDAPFTIYPDGPVTLRQPIRISAGKQSATAVLAITYMACSSHGVCLPPVEYHRLAVTIPPADGAASAQVVTLDEAEELSAAPSALGYKPDGDPFVALAQAKTEATQSGKRILLEVGGDWCIWCHKLDHFFAENPDVADFLDQHFVVLKVHYSTQIPNTAFLSQYPPVAGYPHIFMLDAQGSLLHSQNTGDLETGDHHDRAKVFAFLRQWAAEGTS